SWKFSPVRHFFLSLILVTLPTTLYLACKATKVLSSAKAGLGIRFAALAASVAPLSMNLLGLDFHRWHTLAITTSFLVFSVTALKCRSVTEIMPRQFENAILLPGMLIAINLGSSIPLASSTLLQSFPYEEHVDYIRRVMSGRERFPPEPPICSRAGNC